MEQLLVLSAVGPDRPGLVDKLSTLIFNKGANVAESRMSVLGGEFALIMLIGGSDEAVAAVEASLPEMREQTGMMILGKRTSRRAVEQHLIPYDIRVVSMDHPGIVKGVADFFSQRGINIESLDTMSYPAPHVGTPMFALEMTIGIRADQPVGQLKRDFETYCYELNLDATIEPGR